MTTVALAAGFVTGCSRPDTSAAQHQADSTRYDATLRLGSDSATGQAASGDDPRSSQAARVPAGNASELLREAHDREAELGRALQENALDRAGDLALEIPDLVAAAVARGDFRAGQKDSLDQMVSGLRAQAQSLAQAARAGTASGAKDAFRLLQEQMRTAESTMRGSASP